MRNEATAGVIAPPPLIYLGGLVLGLAADRLLNLPDIALPPSWRMAISAALALAGAAIIAAALGRFRHAKTPAEPWKPTKALATDGVYRITRNPMYLGMTLLLAALAIGLASWGTVAFLPIVVTVVDRFVIQREERYLSSLFPTDYAAYRSRTRRWL